MDKLALFGEVRVSRSHTGAAFSMPEPRPMTERGVFDWTGRTDILVVQPHKLTSRSGAP
jgi:hypothetical protein